MVNYIKRMVLAALAVFALTALPASAGKGDVLHFTLSGSVQRQNPVEQQSDYPWLPGPLDCSQNLRCRINPTPCSWDVDDQWLKFAQDDFLPEGVTVSVSTCMIGDANPQFRKIHDLTTWWSTAKGKFGIWLGTSSPDLIITIAYQSGPSFVLEPQWNQATRRYDYFGCVQVDYLDGDLALGPIAGSNGSQVEGSSEGIGIRHDITLSITNPTSRTVRQIDARVGVRGALSGGSLACDPDLGLPMQVNYPFRFWGYAS